MVRLKDNRLFRLLRPIPQFQFHNGSIKRAYPCFLIHIGIMFQFHNGSIKSFVAARYTKPLIGFNSTMVRLKAGRNEITRTAQDEFQFHNGSIKRKKWQAWITMRLPFQFHNGSIKRGRAADDNNKKRSVSIPQWFD